MSNQNDARPETEPEQNLQVKKYRTLLINMKFDKWNEKRDTRNETKYIALRYIALLITLRCVTLILLCVLSFGLIWFGFVFAVLYCAV